MKNHLLLLPLAVVLAACSSGSGPRDGFRGSALPPIGDPGRIVAVEVAYAQAAREEGQWTAMRRYAADGALVHDDSGPKTLEEFLGDAADPPVSAGWAPTEVWASCDGSLAVSFGRFEDPSGIVGSFVQVWELQSDREYRWTYNMAVVDDPQPEAVVEAEPDENTIVVVEMDSIRGHVADCPSRAGGDQPEALPFFAPPMVRSDADMSDDGTLYWRWLHAPDGRHGIFVDWLKDGEFQPAFDLGAPPAAD